MEKTTRVFLSSSESSRPKAVAPRLGCDNTCQNGEALKRVLKEQKEFWLFLSAERPRWWLAEALLQAPATFSFSDHPPGTHHKVWPSPPLPLSAEKQGLLFSAHE